MQALESLCGLSHSRNLYALQCQRLLSGLSRSHTWTQPLQLLRERPHHLGVRSVALPEPSQYRLAIL
eukprot:10724698-Alexandrium_andersonii.AAC.1